MGKLRNAAPSSADAEIAHLQECREALEAKNDAYWMAQTDVLLKSAEAWRYAAAHEPANAIASLMAAADEEDGLEKLPLTPGPIVPAREQLGAMYLHFQKPEDAVKAFDATLKLAPGRQGALRGKAAAQQQLGRVHAT